jgi:hypothetical protein
MSTRTISNWAVVAGLVVATGGIILYAQLERVVVLRVSLAVLNGAALLRVAALVTALIGTVIGARRAPKPHMLWAAALISFLIVVLAAFVKVMSIDQPPFSCS